MSAYLQVTDLHTHFHPKTSVFGARRDPVKAVNGVSFSLDKGEILGLVGESGCGKSTLSRTIMQLVPPTSGHIVLDGIDFVTLSKAELRRSRLDFQMVFQDPYASLNPRHTVFSTIAEAIRQRHPNTTGEPLTQKVTELMQRCGLNPRAMRKYPHEFSGGQRQRIAIARALAPEPKLLIADEPVSALDVSIQSQILNLLKQLVSDLDLTMVFISHDLSVVRYIADRIAVMHFGKLVEVGPAEEVMDSPRHDYTKTLLSAIPRIDVDSIRGRLATA
ncbi:MAG: ATP-binding cassette domain-containing protein [Verrucomicrobiales bacterium]|nr:ATP-binding cassette domain-containing protein [Verrucomicrobiales bacterium]